jgi:AcrR family transcriptional regulator
MMAHKPTNPATDHPSGYPQPKTLNKWSSVPDGRAALVVAHPGHELCVHGWLEAARPIIFLITDGSGRSGKSRLASTTKIIAAAGARSGSVYGRFPDSAIYKALLEHEFALFVRSAEELAEALVREQIDYVAGDAVEGYNPVHDACRLVINAAVGLANAAGGRIKNFDFALIGRQDACPAGLREEAIWLWLDDEAFGRKLTAMRAYPELADEVNAGLDGQRLKTLGIYGDLFKDLEPVLKGLGAEAFRIECLRPAGRAGNDPDFSDAVPFYERYAEKLVAQGRYNSVIRYRDHLRPLADALARMI